MSTVGNFLLWPKQALRASLDALNEAGPMGIARYGINVPIIESLPTKNKDKLEFEFVVNSNQIHLAHALDATYFPFFIEGKKYSDHPYALIMGEYLNFFKSTSHENFGQLLNINELKSNKNPSINLISTFDINDFIPISDFENDISSRVLRSGVNSLFSELSLLDDNERNQRISTYNTEVEKVLKNKNIYQHALDLSEDSAGTFIPFLSTGKKIIKASTRKAMDKFPAIQKLSEYIEDKTSTKDMNKKNVSILSQINRVARLKRDWK